MKTEIAYIYALVDPRNNEIRYIGKTVKPKSRLAGHISECKRIDVNHHRAKWIKTLLKQNMKPLIIFLKVCPLSEFVYHEANIIKSYRNLTNSDESGQGNIGRNKEILDRQSEKLSKIVYQYDLDGNFIREFKSTRSAGKILKISHTGISRCCNGVTKHAGGYIFKYQKGFVDKVINPNSMKREITEIDSLGNEINKWESIMECTRDTGIDNGNLSKVCNGILKSIKSRFFKFN
jgi:hypothetical protein